jgi:ankyrin repeat protein
MMKRTPIIIIFLSLITSLPACIRGIDSNLLDAAESGDTTIVKELLMNKDANVNVTDLGGNTPLMKAADNNHIETVKYLINNGANISIKDIDGLTAQDKASLRGHKDILRLIAENTRAENREMILRGKTKQNNLRANQHKFRKLW